MIFLRVWWNLSKLNCDFGCLLIKLKSGLVSFFLSWFFIKVLLFWWCVIKFFVFSFWIVLCSEGCDILNCFVSLCFGGSFLFGVNDFLRIIFLSCCKIILDNFVVLIFKDIY